VKAIRVLIVDDHAVLRDGLRALLAAAAGIEVVGTVANGREAVRSAVALAPDVVLMDVAMPDLNGVEATAQVKAKLPGVRVIALSMHGDAEYVHRALEAGAAGYLLKESAARSTSPPPWPGTAGREARGRWRASLRASGRCSSLWWKGAPAPRSGPSFTCRPNRSRPTAAG
jgi:CheY-like chemotaxis protein